MSWVTVTRVDTLNGEELIFFTNRDGTEGSIRSLWRNIDGTERPLASRGLVGEWICIVRGAVVTIG